MNNQAIAPLVVSGKWCRAEVFFVLFLSGNWRISAANLNV